MTTSSMKQVPTPKQALRTWAKKNDIYPAKLAHDCCFTPAHAWEILKGDRDITYETLGRLLIAYGVAGPAPEIASAMRQEVKSSC